MQRRTCSKPSRRTWRKSFRASPTLPSPLSLAPTIASRLEIRSKASAFWCRVVKKFAPSARCGIRHSSLDARMRAASRSPVSSAELQIRTSFSCTKKISRQLLRKKMRAFWKYPRALPQYNLGHGHIVETIRDAERALPGLFFAGNYLEGPAVGKCVENGFQTAEAVRKYLQTAQ